MSALSRFRDIEMLDIYLRNIIPSGNEDLCDKAEQCVVSLGVELRVDGAAGNLLVRKPKNPIPTGYKLPPGTFIWDVDGFPIWYEDYESGIIDCAE